MSTYFRGAAAGTIVPPEAAEAGSLAPPAEDSGIRSFTPAACKRWPAMRSCATTVSSKIWSFSAFLSSRERCSRSSFCIDWANSLSPWEFASIRSWSSLMVLKVSSLHFWISAVLSSTRLESAECSTQVVRFAKSASMSRRVVRQSLSSFFCKSLMVFVKRSASPCCFSSSLRMTSLSSWISFFRAATSVFLSCISIRRSSRNLISSACMVCIMLNGVSKGWSEPRSCGASKGYMPPLEPGRGVTGGNDVPMVVGIATE
mmetsp:Transcript_6128/g.16898  ORF Transcript_6128/g.16898 Transcript_6128/m.16898 type:complete len:259 (-) Transcript_6128:112-888(-)